MCLLCCCSSSPYPHVLHLALIIPTSSLCVSRLSFPPVPEPHIWIIMFEFGPGCLFPMVTTLHQNISNSNSSVLVTPPVWPKQISVVVIKYVNLCSHVQAKLGMFGKVRI